MCVLSAHVTSSPFDVLAFRVTFSPFVSRPRLSCHVLAIRVTSSPPRCRPCHILGTWHLLAGRLCPAHVPDLSVARPHHVSIASLSSAYHIPNPTVSPPCHVSRPSVPRLSIEESPSSSICVTSRLIYPCHVPPLPSVQRSVRRGLS